MTNVVLDSLLKPLEDILAKSTAYHELTHLINKEEGLPPLEESLIKAIPTPYRRVAHDELSAYLTGMIYAGNSIPVMIPHLAAFGLNSRQNGGEAEHYTARIIFGTIAFFMRWQDEKGKDGQDNSLKNQEITMAGDEEIITMLERFLLLTPNEQQLILQKCYQKLFGQKVRIIKYQNKT